MVDKRVLGLAFISLILATLFILTIARENVEQPIEIFQNEYGLTDFKFAMVARENFENVQIRFSIMWEKTLEYNQKMDPEKEYDNSSQAEDVLDNNLKLGWLRNETSLLGVGPEVFDLNVVLGGSSTRMLINDYSGIIDSLSGREAILGSPLIYGGMIDENGQEYNLEGVSCFFVNPADNILSLRISHNDDEQNYLPGNLIYEGYDRIPLSEAPQGGILDYSNVKRDDRFNMFLTVDQRNTPDGFGMVVGADKKNFKFIQMIRIYLDGELYGEPIINIV